MKLKLLELTLAGFLVLPLLGSHIPWHSAWLHDYRRSPGAMTASERNAAAEVMSPFGINVHLALRFQGKDDPSNARKLASDLLAQGRVAWIREAFAWEIIEPEPYAVPHKYRWQVTDYFDYDSSMQILSRQGLNVLGLLSGGPSANVDSGSPYRDLHLCPPEVDHSAAPVDHWLPAWREFVRAVVTRYKDHIHYWEIQNEPNTECFWRKTDKSASFPNAADYVKILQAAYEEIHLIDPEAQVVLSGLAPEINREGGVDYFDYLKQIYDAGGWPYFDILAIHPYRAPSFPEEVLPRSRLNVETLQVQNEPNQYNFTDEVLAFDRLMSHWGSKPIWITEIGWATEALKGRAAQRGTQPEIVQSDYLIRTYVQAIAAGIQNVMWYDFRDDVVPENPTESSFGIVQRDFSPKPAFYALSAMASLLTGGNFQEQVRGQDDRNRPGDDDVYEYRFVKGSQTIIVLWKSRGGDEPRTVEVHNVDVPAVQVFGPDFGPNTLDTGRVVSATNGTISMELTERPVFVVFDTSSSSASIDALLVRQSGFLVLQPGKNGSIYFDLQNMGNVAWTTEGGFLLKNISGETLGTPSAYALENEIPPGQVTRWEIPVLAPEKIGNYSTEWQMTHNGQPFGPVMSCLVLVMPDGGINNNPVVLLTEWFNELLHQVFAKLTELWEDLIRRLEEWLIRELERLWREFWESLFQQCCGANAIAPAVLLLGVWGINRRRRGGTKKNDRN